MGYEANSHGAVRFVAGMGGVVHAFHHIPAMIAEGRTIFISSGNRLLDHELFPR